MSNQPLPQTIKRWCCQGKSCGNTTLHLAEFGGPEGCPKLYAYERGNEESYSGAWLTEEAMRDWLEATKNNLNPEETA